MKKLFGTDGIRGVAGEFPLDAGSLRRIGSALVQVLEPGDGSLRVLIGRDTRISGEEIQNHLVEGLLAMGAKAVTAGVLPTPAIAFITRDMGFDAGVVISASHNEYQDNGIKIFGSGGFKLTDEVEARIERAVLSGRSIVSGSPKRASVEDIHKEAKERFIRFLMGVTCERLDLSGKRVVLDCANGAASEVAPELFERLSAEVHAIGTRPDGTNINLDCGSLHPEKVARAVLEFSADIGVSFDGDADRCILVDETGEVRDGDYILAVLAGRMKEKNLLPVPEIISTVMSNIGLERYLQELGLTLIRTSVGDKYVLEEMLKKKAKLGGEQSGHLIFLDHATTGDGILTSLKVMEVLMRTGKTLSELSSCMRKYPQILVNVSVPAKVPFEEIPEIKKKIDEVESKIRNRGSMILRYSGTEPKIRIMLQGESQSEIEDHANALAEVFRAALGTKRRK